MVDRSIGMPWLRFASAVSATSWILIFRLRVDICILNLIGSRYRVNRLPSGSISAPANENRRVVPFPSDLFWLFTGTVEKMLPNNGEAACCENGLVVTPVYHGGGDRRKSMMRPDRTPLELGRPCP